MIFFRELHMVLFTKTFAQGLYKKQFAKLAALRIPQCTPFATYPSAVKS